MKQADIANPHDGMSVLIYARDKKFKLHQIEFSTEEDVSEKEAVEQTLAHAKNIGCIEYIFYKMQEHYDVHKNETKKIYSAFGFSPREGNANDIIPKMTEFTRDLEIPVWKDLDALLEFTFELMYEEVGETLQALQKGDIAELIDGFGDVAFIAINGIYKTFRARGEDHESATQKTISVMVRICNANLNKKQSDGKVLWNEQGKVQKPRGWVAPKYEDLL